MSENTSPDAPIYFTDDTMERRSRALWMRLVRIHLVMAVFGALALALIDPSLWPFFGVGVLFFSIYALVTIGITRKGLLVPNVACGSCGALGFPGDLRRGEGRCQRCGSEKMWVKGKRKIIRHDSWDPEPGTEQPPRFAKAIPASGVEVLEGAITVHDGFGARAGGE